MKTKHSPGPWEPGHLDLTIIRSADGDIVAIVSERHRSRDVQAANAALIGASPDLLAALKRMLAHYHISEAGPDFRDAWASVRKAEGESESQKEKDRG